MARRSNSGRELAYIRKLLGAICGIKVAPLPFDFVSLKGKWNMIATTANRVSGNTDPEVNARIWRHTEEHMREIAAQGRGAIERRLQELDEEWDIERYVETLAPTFTLLGLSLGLTKDRR